MISERSCDNEDQRLKIQLYDQRNKSDFIIRLYKKIENSSFELNEFYNITIFTVFVTHF